MGAIGGAVVKVPVFQSHGTDDPILSPDVAKRLRDMLLNEGVSVDWHEFRGGHEIPMDVLAISEALSRGLYTIC